MSEIIFVVEEDPEGGYSARALGQSIFTEGETWEELKKNVQEAVACHYEDEADKPNMVRLHLVHDEVVSL
jgi:predicted RNase H-like HicB family nuclease